MVVLVLVFVLLVWQHMILVVGYVVVVFVVLVGFQVSGLAVLDGPDALVFFRPFPLAA